MPGIIHVIQVAFQQNADAGEIAKVCEAFGNLKNTCIKPESRVLYIRSLHWGKDVSPENGQNGFTHMFVVDFASVEDRNYYLEDPAHQAVVAGLKPVVEKVQVMDIERAEDGDQSGTPYFVVREGGLRPLRWRL